MRRLLKLLPLCFILTFGTVLQGYAKAPLYEVTKKEKKRKSKKGPVAGLKNKKLQQACNKWYGANYKYGGCSTSGVDCSCFAKSVYSEVYGINLERSSKNQYKQCKPIKKVKKLKEGDLVFFKISGGKVDHVGIYLKDGKFIHASTKRGVVMSSLDEKYYAKRFFRGGRVK